MRVMLVSDFAPPVRGGLEFHVQALALELVRLGHDVAVATMTAEATIGPGITVFPIASATRFLPHESPERPFHTPIPEPVSFRSLSRAIKQFKPDVVHSHNLLGVSTPRRKDLPLVITAHDYAFVCQLRTLLRPDDSVCSGPGLAKCFSCAKQQNGLIPAVIMTPATIAGRGHIRPSAILAVSSPVARALQPHFKTSIEVVPNFVSSNQVGEPLPPGLPASGFALFAGDPGAHKGVFDLLDIWGGPNPPSVPLVIATTKKLDKEPPPNVTLTSFTKAQMATAFAAASVALAPSRWADPCPTVVLEALRAGTPVIGSTIGGTADIVRHGVDGFLVDPGDQVAIRQRLDEILGDPELAEKLGRSARERAEDYFAEPVVAQIVKVYERVATQPRSVSAR